MNISDIRVGDLVTTSLGGTPFLVYSVNRKGSIKRPATNVTYEVRYDDDEVGLTYRLTNGRFVNAIWPPGLLQHYHENGVPVEQHLSASLYRSLRKQMNDLVDHDVAALIDKVIRPKLDALLQAEFKERLP